MEIYLDSAYKVQKFNSKIMTLSHLIPVDFILAAFLNLIFFHSLFLFCMSSYLGTRQ